MEQIRSLAIRAGVEDAIKDTSLLTCALQAAPSVPDEVLCHQSPPTVPAPLFPKLSKTRQVSPTAEQNRAHLLEVPKSEESTTIIKAEEKGEEGAADGDVGAANLLLMLAKAPACTGKTSELHSAIAPGQFLM